MKNSSTILAFLLMSCLSSLYAQNAGCDGARYKDDVFLDVKKTTVTYAPTISHLNSQMDLMMDVYEPEGDDLLERPVVILAHGGSFLFGQRQDMDRWCRLLAKKGYVAATISYRLYPFFVLGLPDSLKVFDTAVKAVGDMRAAVRYFREDAATVNLFRADAGHIFVGGYSAGAVTALHFSYLDENDNIPAFLQTIINNNGGLEGISGTASNKTYSSRAGATVNMSGGLYRSGWLEADEVPLVSIHGTADGTVPYVSGLAANIAYLQGSSLVHARANEVGLWNSLHTVPGGGHEDIYQNAVYQPHLDTFWVNATNLLESLTCTAVGTKTPDAGSEAWTVSPNPNDGHGLLLQFPADVTTADIEVFNSTGERVYSGRNLQNQNVWNLNGLSAGVYLLRMNTPDNPFRRFAVRKLVVK